MELTAALIGPAHGLRGEAVLDVRSDNPDALQIGVSLATTSSTYPSLTLASLRVHKERVLASFEEIASREEIESVRGVALLVEETEEEDAWYPHQLRGLKACTPDGESLGKVVGLQMGAAQDLLLVSYEGQRIMVPFVRQLVPEVDVAGGRVVIDPPPGLFDADVVEARDPGQLPADQRASRDGE